MKSGKKGAALLALSSLIERNPGDVTLIRDVAFQAQALGYGDHAYYLMRRALTLRPRQPQNLSNMASALVAAGKNEAAVFCFEAALTRSHDARRSFRRCVAFDYVHLLHQIVDDARSPLRAFAEERYAALCKELGLFEADLVVTIGWSTDRTDVDLHVKEPSGEVCYYGHSKTKIGGNLTDDVTGGFGPETYALPNAVAGKYGVSVNYFAADRLRGSARSRVQLTIYTDWGRSNVKVTRQSVLLTKGGMTGMAMLER